MESSFEIKNDIDKSTYEETENHFLLNKNCLIHHLEIDSNGGDYNSAIKIGENISRYPIRATAYNAKSAGFLILQCCTERIAAKDATFLLHFPSFEKGEKIFRHLRIFYNFLEMLSKRTKQSIHFLWKLAASEKVLSAEEALQLHFVDKIE